MSVVDLHPEALIEREALGVLGEADRARLEAHYARCGACRLERQLRSDFADELSDDGPAALDEVSSEVALVKREERVEREGPRSARRPGRRRVARAVWLLAAAAILVGGVAGAQSGATARVWRRLVGAPAETTTLAAQGGAPTPAKHTAHASPRGPSARAESATEPVAGAAPEAEGDVTAATIATSDRIAVPTAATLPEPPGPASLQGTRARGKVATSAARSPAAALFDAASEARRRGDYGEALALHRDLESRFPATREAQVARATIGRLLLDRGEPGSALASFEAYLARGAGELGEEALVGRATALERLGRKDESRRAWEALLAAYPATSYAAHARARIASP